MIFKPKLNFVNSRFMAEFKVILIWSLVKKNTLVNPNLVIDGNISGIFSGGEMIN
jgi:hypothetical protein